MQFEAGCEVGPRFAQPACDRLMALGPGQCSRRSVLYHPPRGATAASTHIALCDSSSTILFFCT